MKKIIAWLIIVSALFLSTFAAFSQSLPNVAFPTSESVADTYTVNITNYGSSYNDKVALINFRTPNGGPATLNITPSGGSALGARPLRIKNSSGDWVPLASGDIPGDSSLFMVHYSTVCGCLRIVPQSTASGGGGGGGTWGSITGTLSDQTDLQDALDGKEDLLTFTASDFNESGQTVSIDYTNGQAASGSNKGFTTSADWLAFSRKQTQRIKYINAQTGTSYTAAAADSITTTLVTMDNASPNNFVLPTNASVPFVVGTMFWVEQIGDGVTSIIPFDGTVTVTYEAGVSAVAAKDALNLVRKTGTNTWKVYNGTPPITTGDFTRTNTTFLTGTITGDPTGALLKSVNISWDLTSAITIPFGGTGLTSYTAGDLIWASATNTLAAKNVFATSQLAYMHIKAGTATANTAPFMLTTGTVNTTAQAGAFEYTTPRLFFTNGRLIRQEIPQIQQSRVSTQFDATSNTTLANITGLTASVAASGTYRFEAELYTTSNVAGGVKFAIAGTATATNIIYECLVIDSNVNAAQTRATSLATTVGAVTAVTVAYAKITGTITVNAAGTLTVQFAQNASNASASSVLVGSTFVITEML